MLKKIKPRFLLISLLISIFAFVGLSQAQVSFSDVEDYWATKSIEWASKRGVVEGFPDGTFKPLQNVKEAEFAAILARYVENTDKAKITERIDRPPA